MNLQSVLFYCEDLLIVLSVMKDFTRPARPLVEQAKEDVTQLIVYVADYESCVIT